MPVVVCQSIKNKLLSRGDVSSREWWHRSRLFLPIFKVTVLERWTISRSNFVQNTVGCSLCQMCNERFGSTFDREQIVSVCGRQRDYFEMAINKRDKAWEYCDQVILAMYTLILPSRGLEVRTLKIIRDWQGFHPCQFKSRNVILLKEVEQVTLHFHNYKTSKFSGRDELTEDIRKLAQRGWRRRKFTK